MGELTLTPSSSRSEPGRRRIEEGVEDSTAVEDEVLCVTVATDTGVVGLSRLGIPGLSRRVKGFQEVSDWGGMDEAEQRVLKG